MRQAVLRLAALSIISAAVQAVTPEGQGRRAVKLVCAAVLFYTLLSSLPLIDTEAFSFDLDAYREEGLRLAEAGQQQTYAETRLVIQQRCEAYILDKARTLGIKSCSCVVTVVWDGEANWSPDNCLISAVCSEVQKNELSRWIQDSLGIPQGGQEWSVQYQGD